MKIQTSHQAVGDCHKVVSLLPLDRFLEAGVTFPDSLEISFRPVVDEAEIVDACVGAEFLLVPAAYPPITQWVLDRVPTVRMIQSIGTGYDKVDIRAAAERGVSVANSPGHNVNAVTEYTVALLITLLRSVLRADKEIKKGNYVSVRESLFSKGIHELSETTVGIVGMGVIGRSVFQLLSLLGAQVIFHESKADLRSHSAYRTFHELLSQSDVVTLHVPLNDGTQGLIGEKELSIMRKGCFLINTSRGEVVDPCALALVLEKGHLAGAAIDTLSPEPPPSDHPLINLSEAAAERLIISPHIAGVTRRSFRLMLQGAVDNIARAASGLVPMHVVNEAQRSTDVGSSTDIN